MKKLTKIIATIGPASDTPEMIEKLIEAGVNVFRFNFKHNVTAWHDERMQRVNAVAAKLGAHIGMLIDLQGPEIRLKIDGEGLEVKKSDKILLSHTFTKSQPKEIIISHPEIIEHLADGQEILADDGYFAFILKKEGKQTFLVAENDGYLKTNKTLNIPGADFPFPVLIDHDYEGLDLALKNKVSYVALSFVRNYADVKILREEMEKRKLNAAIISKIETRMATEDIDAIIAESDGIMVARGDLGVELPIWEVPLHQKKIIRKCLEQGKPVITATQMLESMIVNMRPTRAEVSDIANAVFDHTDAIMLSAESASGKYPLEAVQTMTKTAAYNENTPLVDLRALYKLHLHDQEQQIADTAYNLYLQTHKKTLVEKTLFLVFTQTGRTAMLIARYRPKATIYAFCPDEMAARSLSLSYGIRAFVMEKQYGKTIEVTSEHVRETLEYLRKENLLHDGQKVIVLHGDYWTVEGQTSTVKLIEG